MDINNVPYSKVFQLTVLTYANHNTAFKKNKGSNIFTFHFLLLDINTYKTQNPHSYSLHSLTSTSLPIPMTCVNIILVAQRRNQQLGWTVRHGMKPELVGCRQEQAPCGSGNIGPRMRLQQPTNKRTTRQHSCLATWYFKERPIWTPLIVLVKDETIWRRMYEKIL
jgi:hypothetical protein